MKTLLACLAVALASSRPPNATAKDMPPTATKQADPVDAYLAKLPEALALAKTPEQLRTALAGTATVTVTEGNVSDRSVRFTVQFAARDAAALVAAWKLVRPYAMSGDVHQQTWEIGVWGQDVPDPYNKRIYVRTIEMGAWSVRARLDGRPKGDLPKLVAGASPAYDMAKYSAKVVSIEITLTPR